MGIELSSPFLLTNWYHVTIFNVPYPSDTRCTFFAHFRKLRIGGSSKLLLLEIFTSWSFQILGTAFQMAQYTRRIIGPLVLNFICSLDKGLPSSSHRTFMKRKLFKKSSSIKRYLNFWVAPERFGIWMYN